MCISDHFDTILITSDDRSRGKMVYAGNEDRSIEISLNIQHVLQEC
jgi:hypothetical protein